MKKLFLLYTVFALSPLSQAAQVDVVADLLKKDKITPQQFNDYNEEIEAFTTLCNEKADQNLTTFTPAEKDRFWSLVDDLLSK
ncbi:MAG: hypothetical protein K0M45_02620 [Candidatus Paracaedibacteraceae bacterium]|nr:hypothetical protein [Candidatus Paracaedibacteraceae bacterium]